MKYLTESDEMTPDRKNVYIVDDDESVCRALKCLLLTFGFKVSTFLSSESFFSAVPAGAPGCLIMDIHMPELNGWEVLKRMIKAESRCPVIIISADRNGGLKEQAYKNGAAGFLRKPLNDRELVDLINKVY